MEAEAKEDYGSKWMAAVNWDESVRCGVGRELCSWCGEDVWGDVEVAVVAEGVGGDVAERELFEIGWELTSRGDEELVGAAGVLDAGPEIVASAELEKRFGKVAVLFAAVGERACASPDQCGGPVAGVRACGEAAEGTVVHDGCGLSLLVFAGRQRFGAGDVGDGVLAAPVWGGREGDARGVAVDSVAVGRRLEAPALL